MMDSLTKVDIERLAGAARRVAEIALAIVLGLLVGRLFWLVAAPQGAVASISDSRLVAGAAAGVAGRTPLRADLTLLTSRNLFASGAAEEADGEADEAAPDAPETALNLELRGVRAQTGGDEAGAAVIKTPDNAQGLYSPGDEILQGVRLDRVLSDRVILQKDGQLESLFLSDTPGSLSVIGGEEPRQTVAGASTVVPGAGVAAPPQASDRSGDAAEDEGVDGRAFLRAVRFAPMRELGEITGYRITPRGDPAVMRSAGLEPGDLIVGVNNLRVEDIDSEELIETLDRAERAWLSVERGGEEIDVSVTFRRGSE